MGVATNANARGNDRAAGHVRCSVSDLFALTSRKITDQGFLEAPAAIARTGIQQYTARELGLDGVDPKRVIRLNRPAVEVFKPESMATFDRAPLTVNHPPENVTADNWKDFSVGEAHDPVCTGDVMTANLVIRDAAAIKAVMAGKTQMSNGYSFELDMTPGTTTAGEAYDGSMKDIRGNHVAIVDFARGGSALRVADHDTPTKEKRMKTVTIGDVAIKFEDETAGSLAEKVVGDAVKTAKTATDAASVAMTRAEKAEKDLADEKAKTAKLVTDHAAALKAAEDKILKPEAIEALSVERAKVIGDAAAIAPELKVEGKSVDAIRAEALKIATDADEECKAIVSAITGDAAEVPAAEVKKAFDAAVVLLAKRDTSLVSGSNDTAALGRAVTGDRGRASAGMSARSLFIYRQNHGGKSPGEKSKASA